MGSYIDAAANNKPSKQEKRKAYRDYVYRRSLSLGEDLMPCDVVDIMKKASRSGKFKDGLFLYMDYSLQKLEILIDVYESCGFVFPNKEISIINMQDYFN